MTITDDELKAQAESYAATDAASRGPRHAGISDEELCKALRHRAGLPETCATDAYVMLQAEQRIKLALRQSSPPDGQTSDGWVQVPPGKAVMFVDTDQPGNFGTSPHSTPDKSTGRGTLSDLADLIARVEGAKMSDEALGEIQDMLTDKLASVRSQIRNCEGGLFWRSDEDERRVQRLGVLKEVETELVRLLEASYE